MLSCYPRTSDLSLKWSKQIKDLNREASRWKINIKVFNLTKKKKKSLSFVIPPLLLPLSIPAILLSCTLPNKAENAIKITLKTLQHAKFWNRRNWDAVINSEVCDSFIDTMGRGELNGWERWLPVMYERGKEKEKGERERMCACVCVCVCV